MTGDLLGPIKRRVLSPFLSLNSILGLVLRFNSIKIAANMTKQSVERDTVGNAVFSRSDLTQYDISPLPDVMKHGLIAIILIASLSALMSLSLLVFIAYRLIFWRSFSSQYLGYNQYIILIYQLILADLQHALGYLISVKWLVEDKVTPESWACFVQGVWLQLANPASGLFVLAIAFHTFFAVMLNRKLSYGAFVTSIISIWIFLVAIAVIPIAMHGREVMVPSGAWVGRLTCQRMCKTVNTFQLKSTLVLDQSCIRTPSPLHSLPLDLLCRVWRCVPLCHCGVPNPQIDDSLFNPRQ